MTKSTRRLIGGMSILIVGLVGGGVLAQQALMAPGFADLQPKTDIIYLLANSSIIIGPDVGGPSEDLTFTGTVAVPKFPVAGFERRQLQDGSYQIDFELTSSELRGESYLMNGPVLLGEHPDLRSLGTITQRDGGADYPADFIVQRKVLIETPKGIMYNRDPVPVRGTIDSIPPVRSNASGQPSAINEINVFRGEKLPVPLLDPDGSIAGFFYSRVHVAFAVQPVAIHRMVVNGEIGLAVGDRRETVQLVGTVEAVDRVDRDGASEFVMLALRGESELLEGPIMVAEAFHHEDKVSGGRFGNESSFDMFLQVKTPAGILELEEAAPLNGMSETPLQTGEVDLGDRGTVPVYHVPMFLEWNGSKRIFDEAGREVGDLTALNLWAGREAGKRPCCPRR